MIFENNNALKYDVIGRAQNISRKKAPIVIIEKERESIKKRVLLSNNAHFRQV